MCWALINYVLKATKGQFLFQSQRNAMRVGHDSVTSMQHSMHIITSTNFSYVNTVALWNIKPTIQSYSNSSKCCFK